MTPGDAVSHKRLIHRLWLVLVALTIGGALVGDTLEPSLTVTLLVCLTMAFKGRMVVDHFMELKHANPTIRRLMRGYFYVLPLLTLLTVLFGDVLARLTTL